MSKSSKPSQVDAPQYETVPVVPVSCSAEEQERHIRAFIERFVVEAAQARWIELLIEKRQEGADRPRVHPASQKLYLATNRLMDSFPANRQEAYCTRLAGTQTWPLSLRQAFGEVRGVYFDLLRSAPCKMTAAEAMTEAFENYAILSFVSGESALLFTHDGLVWKCQRR